MRLLCLALAFVITASVAAAQDTTAEVVQDAPIYIRAEVTQAPLRVAAAGTTLAVLKEAGDWTQVQFKDPQYGLRTGWVARSHLRTTTKTPPAMDLSVESASPAPTAQPAVVAAAALPPATGGRPTLYITPTDDHFEVYLSAAMVKKGVPVVVTNNPKVANFVLSASAVNIQKQSTGSKFARCIFASCAGIEDRGATSVQMLQGDIVVWSYSVNKGRGQKNHQSLAEAVAKHLRSEYFERGR